MTASDPFDALRAALGRPGAESSDYDLNAGIVLPKSRVLRPAGVLVPVIQRNDGLHVILTKRSSALRHHPGQIAFPGGKQDEADIDVTAAALREAQEEIGLDPANVDVIGQLPSHETVTGFSITPVIGHVRSEFVYHPEPDEVDEVFDVPLSHVLALQNYSVQSRRWRGQQRHYFTVPCGPYYIWGATARILRGLADRVQQ